MHLAYPPETIDFSSIPVGPRRVVLASSAPDAASLPAAVEALDLDDAPSARPRRGAYRAHVTGRGGPANMGHRPTPLQRLEQEMDEEEEEKKKGKKEKTD